MTTKPDRWQKYREENGGWYGLTIMVVGSLLAFIAKVAILTVVVITVARWMGM
jgi:hypothetical protein